MWYKEKVMILENEMKDLKMENEYKQQTIQKL